LAKEACHIYVDNLKYQTLLAFKFKPDENNSVMTMVMTDDDMTYGELPNQKANYIPKAIETRTFQGVMGPSLDDREVAPEKKEEGRKKLEKKDNYKLDKMIFANGDIYIYNDLGKLDEKHREGDKTKAKNKIAGRAIRSALQIDKSFTYTISDHRYQWDNKTGNFSKDGKVLFAVLYIYDYDRMLKTGKVEVYKVRDTIGGINNHMDFSLFMQDNVHDQSRRASDHPHRSQERDQLLWNQAKVGLLHLAPQQSQRTVHSCGQGGSAD